MLAFDGNATSFRSIELHAGLFKDLPLHLVMAGADTGQHSYKLQLAVEALSSCGVEIPVAIRSGDEVETPHIYHEQHDIDVLAMGAYGHSGIRQFLIGSTTTQMLETVRHARGSVAKLPLNKKLA